MKSRFDWKGLPSLVVLLSALACGDGATGPAGTEVTIEAVPGTAVVFDLDADLSQEDSFYDLPWPSDLRLSADGRPRLEGFPGAAGNGVVGPVLLVADRRRGHSVNPSAIFQFDGGLVARTVDRRIAASPDAPLGLVDVDPASSERGRFFPLVAETRSGDPFSPDFTLSVSVAPGVVLAPDRTYAFLVRHSLGDASGASLGTPKDFALLRAGRTPEAAAGEEAVRVYSPLWETLDELGIPRDEVAAATVFTTGDVVADLASWMDALAPTVPVQLMGLSVEPDGGADHERFCELTASIDMPQLQRGAPPYDVDGDFELDPSGVPVVQRRERVPVVLTVPRDPKPASGYPLVLYVHGSGGSADQVVDRGPVLEAGGERQPGAGPAHVFAGHGIATAAPAMPLNPERLPGATPREYLNFLNLGAYPYTFQQGTFELRLLLDALGGLRASEDVLSACGLPTEAADTPLFDTTRVGLHGQSMGAQYANMLGAVDRRVEAVMPTGSGGLWTLVILSATIEGGLKVGTLIGPLLGTDQPVSYLHPALQLVELALEPAETLVFAPRIGHRPLVGHPARHLFQPVGQNDPGFPEEIYDAMALASANRQAGDILWSSLQDVLALDQLEGLDAYPVRQNQRSLDGRDRTGVVVQYEEDGILDGHHVFAQRDDLKHQYGCWFESFFDDGVPTLPAPGAIGAPCR